MSSLSLLLTGSLNKQCHEKTGSYINNNNYYNYNNGLFDVYNCKYPIQNVITNNNNNNINNNLSRS